MKRILAIDFGTTAGWAARDVDGSVLSGVWGFAHSPSDPGRRWGSFLDRLDHQEPDVVVFERVDFRQSSRGASNTYAGFLAMLELYAHQRGLTRRPCELVGVGVGQLKKWATGNGRAKKDRMEQAARRRWPDIVLEDDNHADALLLLAYAIRGSGGPVPPERPPASAALELKF